MKKIGFFFLILCIVACDRGQQLESKNGFAVLPKLKSGESVATYAGGCYWAMQECLLELKGVHTAISGYAGGEKAHPTYEEVLSGKTGHAESVQVYYDPKVISFKQLTAAFFNAHDPRQINRQGPDVGSDYRSIAFYRSKEEELVIRGLISEMESLNGYEIPVATEVSPIDVFYPAETGHQDYYRRNPWDFYIRNVSKPKVLKLRKKMPELIKTEYLD